MQLERIIAQVKRLPATPQLLPKLMQVLKDPTASSEEIVEMVKLDLSVAAQVQRLSNSTYYGFSDSSRDLNQAISRIGMQETYKLVAAVLSQQMSARPVNLPGLSGRRIWESSIASALTMETLAHFLDHEVVNAYSIGLFHNIGIILISHADATTYAECLKKAADENISLTDAEQLVLGWDHAHAAAVLLRQWKFPESIVEPIEKQYLPHEAQEHSEEAAMMTLTHYLIYHLNLGIPSIVISQETLDWVLQKLNLQPESLHDLLEQANAQVAKIHELLGSKAKS